MNKSDSERIASVFESLGYKRASSEKQADFVVINACSVRQTAIDRVWGKLKHWKHKKDLVRILTGCVLTEDKDKFKKEFDLVFNIKDLFKLEVFLNNEQQSCSDDYFNVLPKYKSRFQASVPIMTGCNNFCSYCAVPYVRGREISRSVKEILTEVKSLVKNGCLEITLLGQNVNSFSPKDKDFFSLKNPFKHNFAKLLWEINQLSSLNRVLFASAHPKDMTDEVIQALALPKMVNYLHLALQSGDNQVLEKMNRKYTVEDYEKIIKKIRKVKSEIALGTDIIVGFPGETEEQFKNTYEFYKKIGFDIAYIGKYSPRSGTKAAELEDDVLNLEKKKRWRQVQDLMEKIALEKNQRFLNQKVSVLIEKKTKEGFYEGNSKEMKRVWIKSSKNLIGKIVNVKIIDVKEWLLFGELGS